MSTSTTPRRTLLIVGSGPGIGTSVPLHFTSRHPFTTTVLLARNPSRLSDTKSRLLSSRPELDVRTYTVDVADQEKLREVLEEVRDEVGGVECVFFNAARVAGKGLLEEEGKVIEEDFKITNLALYTTCQVLLPHLLSFSTQTPPPTTQPPYRPTLLVTNSLLYAHPLPPLFSLSLTKSAQRTLVQCLSQQFGKEVHVGLVTVGGQVSEKGGKGMVGVERVAEGAWGLFGQEKGAWEEEVEVLVED